MAPTDPDTAAAPARLKRGAGGTKTPHIGFRLDAALIARVDAIGAAMAARVPMLPPPDRSAVLRAVVAAGCAACEAQLGIASPPSTPAPAAPPQPAQGALPFGGPAAPPPAPSSAPIAAGQEEPAPSTAAPSGRGGGKATKGAKGAKGAKPARRR